VVTAVNEERRTLRIGGLATIAVLIVAGVAFFFFYRRGQEQNIRVYAAITRLQTGVLTQQQLMERSRRALEDVERGPSLVSDPQKLQLEKKSEDLRSQIAIGKTENTSALQNQLTAVESRLQKLETEGQVAQTIIQSYEPSVCLIHVVLGFRDHITGLRLHYAGVTSSGEPTTDEHNNPLVSLTGTGPEVHLDVFGTGFLPGSPYLQGADGNWPRQREAFRQCLSGMGRSSGKAHGSLSHSLDRDLGSECLRQTSLWPE